MSWTLLARALSRHSAAGGRRSLLALGGGLTLGAAVVVGGRERLGLEEVLPSSLGLRKAACFFGGGGAGEISEKEREAKLRKVIAKADELYDNYLCDNVYNGLAHYRDWKDPEVLWRFARICVELSKQTRNGNESAELIAEGWDAIEEAVSVEPPQGIAAIHKWRAILINCRATMLGKRKLIETAPEMKQELDRAAELDPKDPTTQHMIGRYYFGAADMSAIMRGIATAMYGSLPKGTYEDALRYFEAAEALEPGFYGQNSLFLAKTLLALKQREEEAERHLVSAYNRIVISPDDRNSKTEAGKILYRRGRLSDEGRVIPKR